MARYKDAIYVRIPERMRTDLVNIQNDLNSQGYNVSLSDMIRAGAEKFIKEFRELKQKGEL
jgi:hypothetical protein